MYYTVVSIVYVMYSEKSLRKIPITILHYFEIFFSTPILDADLEQTRFPHCLRLNFPKFRIWIFGLGRIHLVFNASLTDDTSVKWAQIKTFYVFSNFVETW